MNQLVTTNRGGNHLKAKDIFLWIVVVALVATGVWANYYYANYDVALRLAGWIVLAVVCVGLASLTSYGEKSAAFLKESKRELKKVVWPDRHTAIKTTFMVTLIVIIMSLILWAIDTLLFWGVGQIMS